MWELYAQKQKSNERSMAKTIVGETKKEGQKMSKHEKPARTKRWEKN